MLTIPMLVKNNWRLVLAVGLVLVVTSLLWYAKHESARADDLESQLSIQQAVNADNLKALADIKTETARQVAALATINTESDHDSCAIQQIRQVIKQVPDGNLAPVLLDMFDGLRKQSVTR